MHEAPSCRVHFAVASGTEAPALTELTLLCLLPGVSPSLLLEVTTIYHCGVLFCFVFNLLLLRNKASPSLRPEQYLLIPRGSCTGPGLADLTAPHLPSQVLA